MDDTHSQATLDIAEFSQMLQKIDIKFKENTKILEQFLSTAEMEELWSKLKNDTNLLYESMVQQITRYNDEKNDICKKVEEKSQKNPNEV